MLAKLMARTHGAEGAQRGVAQDSVFARKPSVARRRPFPSIFSNIQAARRHDVRVRITQSFESAR
jgi:hypothetical protein